MLRVGSTDLAALTHDQLISLIKASGNKLTIGLRRHVARPVLGRGMSEQSMDESDGDESTSTVQVIVTRKTMEDSFGFSVGSSGECYARSAKRFGTRLQQHAP